MTKLYNVHVYREMRLVFNGIEAGSPEEAAEKARDRHFDDADDWSDCEGESLSALVDLAGDEKCEQSVTIDFEAERERKAGSAMLTALQAFITADAMAKECHEWKWENLEHAFTLAREAIAQADAASIPLAPDGIGIDTYLARNHQIAVVWSIEDVLQERPDLSTDQAWEVLQSVKQDHDANYGITWQTLEWAAKDLFGNAPETNEDEE